MNKNEHTDSRELYSLLEKQLAALIEDERRPIPNLANASALIFDALSNINWAGFYLADGDELVLGPFQGRPACVKIPFGRGVCGNAAADNKPLVVPDVSRFEGHIACDSRSKSEIVIPLSFGGKVVGVMDIDSAELNRFDGQDLAGLSALARLLESGCNFEA